MFSGIIDTAAAVTAVRASDVGRRLTVDLSALREAATIRTGDSIAVDGVCLTVASLQPSQPSLQMPADAGSAPSPAGLAGSPPLCGDFDVIHETLSKTTLGQLAVGRRVNLERSLRVGDRLDGHMVQGHVDGIGVIREVDTTGGQWLVWIEPPSVLLPFICPRGSITVCGVSLTVARLEGGRFAVALIPTTLERTNLGSLAPGSDVNLETDILARQIVHWLSLRESS